jgi:hypothetical protein
MLETSKFILLIWIATLAPTEGYSIRGQTTQKGRPDNLLHIKINIKKTRKPKKPKKDKKPTGLVFFF